MPESIHIHSQLVARSRKGERRAQGELYGLYSKAMYNVSVRILNSREEAEDVLQESFIKAFQNLNSFREEANFGSWLKRIVINTSLNRVKKKKLHFIELKDDKTEGSIEEDVPDADGPPDFTVEEIKVAVSRLADGFRSIFTLYMFEDWSHKQIAEELGISVSTSKSQLNRAKKRVGEELMRMKDGTQQA